MKPDAMERSEDICNRGCGDSTEIKGKWRKRKEDASCENLTLQVVTSRKMRIDANLVYEIGYSIQYAHLRGRKSSNCKEQECHQVYKNVLTSNTMGGCNR